MPKTAPFNTYHERYEDWFAKHEKAYLSELLALRPFVPWEGKGIEIGVGSGRFAAPLGISTGIDPSSQMLGHAVARGVSGVSGIAEDLPFAGGSFNHGLVVTTLCFVDSPQKMLSEIQRVLAPGGRVVIGFVDRESALGQNYLAHQAESDFYKEATFFSTEEVRQMLVDRDFLIEGEGQTLALPLSETHEIEPLRPGHGQCAFVVIAAKKR